MSHSRTTVAPATPAEPAARAARAHVPPGVILAIACVANFMVIIDTSIVNVALPAMKAALGLSAAGQQWVVDAYLITFGGFLLLAARAGDLFGRKGVFQAGLTVFTAASLAGGLAQDPWLLIAARVLQGIGAAALASSSLSLITASHPEGPARTRALSLWAAVGSSAGAVGVVLGGLLTTGLSWRYVLFINVPLGVVLLIVAAASPVPSPPRHDGGRLDLPGALTVTAGVSVLVFAVSQATSQGWGSAPVLAALTAAVILLAAFGMIEVRSAVPLVPLSILRRRSLAVGNTLMACLGVVMTSGFFFLSLYFQQILGYSALRTGAAIVPMTVLLAAGPLTAKRLLPRFGPRFLTLAGGTLTTAGMAWMSLLPDHSDYLARVLGPMLVTATGIGLMTLPLAASATAGIETRYAGLASGLFNTGRQLGGAIGLAVLVTIAATATRHSQLASPAAATVHGYRIALLSCAAVSLAGVLIALLLPAPANTALATLRRDFGGDIIEPGGADYESASRTLLASGHPAYVLQPGSVRDVQAGVRFAASTGLALSVRGGGHGFPGFGTNGGGVVIDLSQLANVEITDSERHLVRIGGGATWGQVAAALAPHGLAISSGDTKSVGVGGLTLTGGIGWKVRKHGLALDHVVAAEVVTASGEVVPASAAANPELFWAIRGGGGNFGIVTAFEFAAHPTTDVFYGKIAFPASEAATVIRGWADYLRTAPDELTSTADVANPFRGPGAPVEIHVAFDGDDPELAARAIDPIRRLGTVLDDDVELRPYPDTLADGPPPPSGLVFAIRSAFAGQESVPAVLQILAEVRASERSPFIAVRSVSGAVSRVPHGTTAYAHRQAELMVVTTSAGPEPAVEAARPDLEAIWARLAPHVSGAYANFLSAAAAEDVAAIYPSEVYNRLAAVKRQYDPGNLFAGNHNIRPQAPRPCITAGAASFPACPGTRCCGAPGPPRSAGTTGR